MTQDIEDQILEAAKKFKEAIELTGKKNVVILYTYSSPTSDSKGQDIMAGYQSDSLIQAVGSCEFIKDMFLKRKLH